MQTSLIHHPAEGWMLPVLDHHCHLGIAETVQNLRYFTINHPSATAKDVVAMEIAIEVAISFAHSQYDT